MILRFNFSMAIVCMTDGGGENSFANGTNVTSTEPEFSWDKSVQGRDKFFEYDCTIKFGLQFQLIFSRRIHAEFIFLRIHCHSNRWWHDL